MQIAPEELDIEKQVQEALSKRKCNVEWKYVRRHDLCVTLFACNCVHTHELSHIDPPCRRFWGGSTLYHIDDLPFDVSRVGSARGMPQIFTTFRKLVESAARIRAPAPEPTALKPSPTMDVGVSDAGSFDAGAVFPLAHVPLPHMANVSDGLIPSLHALGVPDLSSHLAALSMLSMYTHFAAQCVHARCVPCTLRGVTTHVQ